MTFNLVLPFLSFAIMLTFTVVVLQRYVVRRKLHFLFWGIGLGMFAVGSFGEAFLAIGWNSWVFFFWYLCGAVLTAAWIGQGTVYLLFRKPWVHALTAILIVGSLVAAVMLLQTMGRLNAALFTPAVAISEQYRNIMPAVGDGGAVRLTTPFFNIYGLVTLAGGALWSAYLFWRKRVLPNRVVGNVLIAAGALSIGLASTLTRLGNGSYLYAGELAAAALMFAGFMMAAKPQPQEEATRPAAQTGV